MKEKNEVVREEKITRDPFPNSEKIYVQGEIHPEVKVAMRKVTCSDTTTLAEPEKNDHVLIYDTSGPYTDPSIEIDVRKGLAPMRQSWIMKRGDVEEVESFIPLRALSGHTSKKAQVSARVSVRIGT